MPKKKAQFVEHVGGYFLAIDGDINNRDVVVNDKEFIKTLNKYIKYVIKTYKMFEYNDVKLTVEADLTDIEVKLEIDKAYDPNAVDPLTAEVKTDDTTLVEEAPQPPKSNTNSLKTSEMNKKENKNGASIDANTRFNNASKGATKGWATRRANAKAKEQAILSAQIEAAAVLAEQAKNEPVPPLNAKAKATAPVEEAKPKATHRVRRGLARGTNVVITVPTDIAITGLILGSDILFSLAEGIAWTQAVAVKPLGLHPDATRRELKEAAITRTENRLATVYAIPANVAAVPKKLKAMKEKMKAKLDRNVTDVEAVPVS